MGEAQPGVGGVCTRDMESALLSGIFLHHVKTMYNLIRNMAVYINISTFRPGLLRMR